MLWVGLSLALIALAMGRLRRIRDTELRIDLAAIFAVPVALLIIGVSGPVMSSSAAGPFFWFAVGIAAYWFAGPGTKELAGPPLTQASSSRTDPVPVG